MASDIIYLYVCMYVYIYICIAHLRHLAGGIDVCGTRQSVGWTMKSLSGQRRRRQWRCWAGRVSTPTFSRAHRHRAIGRLLRSMPKRFTTGRKWLLSWSHGSADCFGNFGILCYHLVNIQKAMERSTIFNGKISTISTGPFSMAMLVHQRVSCKFM